MYSVDLIDLWRQRRWRHLLILIDGLPPHSRYIQAMYSDDEFMEMVESTKDEDGNSEYTPPLSTWTPEVELLAQTVDILKVVQQTIVGVNGGKAKRPEPVKRPLSNSSRPTELTESQKEIMDLFIPNT